MAKKQGGMLKRLRITQGPVFKKVFGDRPDLCQELIERTIGIRISSIRIVQDEKELEIGEEWRGGRVDLYVEDEGGNHYDIEMQATPHGDEILRARHYHALMDSTFLQKGGKVANLPRSIVIFICDFDPFGDKQRVYDCRTVCLQTKKTVADGRRTVFLSATAKEGEVSSELDAFLRYVADEDVEGDPFVDELKSVVHSCYEDREWLEDFMTVEEWYQRELEGQVKQGIEQGIQQGIEQGIEQGKRQGLLEGLAALVRDNLLDEEVAAERAGVTLKELREAVEKVGECGAVEQFGEREAVEQVGE